MLRGPLAEPGFKGHFSGHETFPLRHLWLRKAYDAVCSAKTGRPRSLFTEAAAISRFGVGKNMVTSIRHWAIVCDIIEWNGERLRSSKLGDFLFSSGTGRDPFMEYLATTWLLHWKIATNAGLKTTWFYAFNHFSAEAFERETLEIPLQDLCRKRTRQRISAATIKRDVECFVRCYVPKAGRQGYDDSMEAVLAELGLIRAVGRRGFSFRRGPKPTLPDGVFLYALEEFWNQYAPDQNTMAVERIAFEPGSPGRIFKLDERSLIERLAPIEANSEGRFAWSDTAGLRNVARRSGEINPFELLDLAYRNGLDAGRQ